MKLKPHERREKALEKPLINQKLIDYLNLTLQKVYFKPKEHTVEDNLSQEVKEVINLPAFINLLHNLLTFQLKNKQEISDELIIALLPEIKSRIKIPENTYLKIELALLEFFSQRNLPKQLITDNIQIKKNIIKNKLKQEGVSLDDASIHELATNTRIEEGILGCCIYIDKDTYLKFENRPNLSGMFFRLKYKPNFKKKNKKDYEIAIPIKIERNLSPSKNLNPEDPTRVHEEMHGLFYFLKDQLKANPINSNDQAEITETEKNRLLKEFNEATGDINDRDSVKYAKFKLLFDYFKNSELPILKFNFYNELCASIESGSSFTKMYNNPNYYLKEIDSFISQIRYQKKFLYGSYKLRKRLNQPNLDQLIESEVSKFNQELMKEIREIQDLVLQILAKHPDQARLLIYLISVSDVDTVKNNIENLLKFFDFYESYHNY